MKHNIFISLLLLCLFVRCEKQEYDVPADVEVHIQTFRQEAYNRGYNYQIDKMKVYYIDDSELSGALATIKVSKRGMITLKLNRRYWDVYKDYPLRREGIIMHELGHYPMGRDHNTLDNSIMNEKGASQIVKYETNREEMLNELFSI